MKVLKKTKASVTFFVLLFTLIGGLSAQSGIGVQMPPYKASAMDFSKMNTFSLDKNPFEVDKAIFIDTYVEPFAFNSPLVDDMLTTFVAINQFNQNPMPFFCKMEFQMEQAARFPIKIRLGDVNFVDRLESKKDWELGN